MCVLNDLNGDEMKNKRIPMKNRFCHKATGIVFSTLETHARIDHRQRNVGARE